MKAKLFFFALLCFNFSFGQNSQSFNAVNASITAVPVTIPPTSAPNEIFRFQPGNVTQLDTPVSQGFNFTNARWFSMGRVVTGANTAYGLRFQLPNKAVTFGYQSTASNNPRIEWIGTGSNLGNLEFRVGNSFTSTISTLVATMTSNGRTIFSGAGNFTNTSNLYGANQRVSIGGGLSVDASSFEGVQGVGIYSEAKVPNLQSNFGILGTASGANSNIAIKGTVNDEAAVGAFSAAIYGEVQREGNFGGITNLWAGFFDGSVFTTGSYQTSDAKLKENMNSESTALEKLSKLKPVTYKYKEIKQLNLPKEIQHGFVAQDIETIFPELVRDINKPVYGKDSNTTENFSYKVVNYNGLISVLTAGINELNQELQLLKDEIITLKQEMSKGAASKSSAEASTNGAFMEQNIPNPFADQTTIRFGLPEGSNTAEIIVFDLNGLFKKNYPINSNQSELIVKSSDIGRGYFIYSLVQNGQELVTKKMIVK